MTQLFTNNQSTTLASSLPIGSSTATITNTSAFSTPTPPQYELLTITDGSSIEIVKMTSRTGGTIVVTRAQEGTSEVAWNSGAKIEARITKGTLENCVQKNNTSVIAGSLAIAGSYDNLTERAVSTAYAYLDIRYVFVSPTYYILKCIVAGTSSAGSITGLSGITEIIRDGTVTWVATPVQLNSVGNVAIGLEAKTPYGGSIAIGTGSIGGFSSAVAVGDNTFADYLGIAIGSSSFSDKSRAISLGASSYSAFESGVHISGLPDSSSYPSWMFGSEYQSYTSYIGILQSEPLDLAGGSTWAASTTYNHGYVVKPTTPNGKQYVRYDNAYNKWYDPTYIPSSSGSTEPTWTTTFGGSVIDGGGYWLCMTTDGSYVLSLPLNAYMVIEEIGFIAFDVSAVTVQPTISIGTTGDLVKVANAQTTSGLTSNHTVWKYVPSNPVMVPDITIKVDTLATGTRLLGRFYFKGYLTRHWV